jgi:hypothetical protein
MRPLVIVAAWLGTLILLNVVAAQSESAAAAEPVVRESGMGKLRRRMFAGKLHTAPTPLPWPNP